MDGDGECGFESEKVDRVVPCRWRDQNVFFNPKGCERVAGGRSEAKTSGSGMIGLHPERVPAFALEQHLAPFQGAEDQLDPGLRWSASTGYYLAALRAVFALIRISAKPAAVYVRQG